MQKSENHSIGARITIALVFSAQLFLLVPITIFLGNIAEFSTPLSALLKILMIPALLTLGVIFIASGWRGAAVRERFIALLAALSILVWVQASLFVWDYGPLDGRAIDWEQRAWQSWLDLGVWCAIFVTVSVYGIRLRKGLMLGAVALCVLQLVTVAGTAVQRMDALRGQARARTTTHALDAMPRFSSTKNVVHIVLDSFQSDIFKAIAIDDPAGERYRQALDGFTFFEAQLGIFPYTQFALPAALGAPLYHNQQPKAEYFAASYGGNTILNVAAAAGYEVDIASPESLLLGLFGHGQRTHTYNIWDSTHIAGGSRLQADAAKLLDLALFRIAPQRFKRYVYADQKWLLQDLLPGADILNFAYMTDNLFLRYLTQKMSAEREVPVYKFFHLMNTHAPIVARPDCSFAGQGLPRNRDTVITQSRCSLDFIVAVLEKLKALGIYDNTMIVLMGDHGGHISPLRYTSEPIVEGAQTYLIDPWLVAMASPLMLVKAPGARGVLRVSTAPSSITDTAATINAAMALGGIFDGVSVLELGADQARTRLFHYYGWQKSDYTTTYVLPIQEYFVRGNHFDSQSWRAGAVYAAPGDEGRSPFE